MSAFVVGPDHIDYLLTYAVGLSDIGMKGDRVSYWLPDTGNRVEITLHNATEIGRILLAENEISVNHRYPGDRELPGWNGASAAYRFRRFREPMSALAVIKAVHCLQYQSCEHDGWEASLAAAICRAIERKAINYLPGYDDAPGWEIQRTRPGLEVVQ